jgi:hypothetical protein
MSWDTEGWLTQSVSAALDMVPARAASQKARS